MPDLSPLPFSPCLKNAEAPQFVNTNDVLQTFLQGVPTTGRSRIVLRCGELSPVRVRQADHEIIFSALLLFTLCGSKNVSRQLIHNYCNSDDPARQASQVLKPFIVQVNNHPEAPDNWLRNDGKEIADDTALIERTEGSLAVGHLKLAGCIFSISLPGKTA